MITRIRQVRRARGMTLDDVARACIPPTTPQTIGRLETGTRTVSIGWLNRIAAALDVEPQELVQSGDTAELPVAALLASNGAVAPRKAAIVVPPRVHEGLVAIVVINSIGDYRAGDELWCETLGLDDFHHALNRDVLAPRPAGRFVFGRMINRDAEKIQILPLESGGRQQILPNPPWLAVARKLVRSL